MYSCYSTLTSVSFFISWCIPSSVFLSFLDVAYLHFPHSPVPLRFSLFKLLYFSIDVKYLSLLLLLLLYSFILKVMVNFPYSKKSDQYDSKFRQQLLLKTELCGQCVMFQTQLPVAFRFRRCRLVHHTRCNCQPYCTPLPFSFNFINSTVPLSHIRSRTITGHSLTINTV